MANSSQHQPLASRYRPQAAEDIVGQQAVWAPGTPLWKLVHGDRFHALLLWGPPGTGKTSMARLFGQIVGRPVAELSAVEAGVKDIRDIINQSRKLVLQQGKSKILFLDEIHRLSRNQQDCLLPAVETGEIKLIGATTENPSFTVNNALLSRCLTISLGKLNQIDLMNLVQKVAFKEKRPIADDVAAALARAADGDARAVLQLLDSLLAVTEDREILDLASITPLLHLIAKHYDRDGDFHYDLISAFIKCIRASDPDGALYYLARMLHGGEDPVFIGRRLVIAASEDIGNAHPTALVLAQGALAAVKEIGMPEARIILGQATTYLASSPKSNKSYVGINLALDLVKATGDLPVPLHLRNAPTRFMKDQGYGKGYIYPHDDPEKAKEVNNLPDEIQDKRFYKPSVHGSEKQIIEYLKKMHPKKSWN